jgi:hypothetical protein
MEKKNALFGSLIPQKLLLKSKLHREVLSEALIMMSAPKECCEERQSK